MKIIILIIKRNINIGKLMLIARITNDATVRLKV